MLSLTIIRLQGIIPKMMALRRGWFRHARRDLRRFASLGTKRIRTWPYLTSPWVTWCPNTPLCLISFLTFYFLETSHSTLFHCCSNGPCCGLEFPSHYGHCREGCFIHEGYAHGHGELVHCITLRHLTICTHEVAVTNLRWDNLMLVTLCISSSNLMIF